VAPVCCGGKHFLRRSLEGWIDKLMDGWMDGWINYGRQDEDGIMDRRMDLPLAYSRWKDNLRDISSVSLYFFSFSFFLYNIDEWWLFMNGRAVAIAHCTLITALNSPPPVGTHPF
jgi:hypothetical protein